MALDFRVRIAWATDPFSVSPTWVDVSGFVDVGSASINVTRGTGDLDDSVNPGTLSLTFDNHDGRFTPGYTGGAYYPNVVLGKRIQVHETLNGVLFNPVFDGYLDTLPMQWAPTGRYAEAQVTAVDRLKKFGKQLFTDSIVSTYILADSPTDYWDLGDPAGTVNPRNRTGTTLLASTGTGFQSTVTSVVDWGSGTGVGTDGLPAVQISNGVLWGTGSTVYDSQNITVELFALIESHNTSDVFDLATLEPGVGAPTGPVQLQVGSAGVAIFRVKNTAGLDLAKATGVTNVRDGRTHHIAGTCDGSFINVYVDGVLDNSAACAFTSYTQPVQSVLYDLANDPANLPTCTYSHLALFQGVLSAGQIAVHAAVGLTGFSGESSTSRFTRIAGLAGVTAVTTGTAGTASMGSIGPVEGVSLLDELQAVQDTENGAFFVQTGGALEFVTRTVFYNQAAALTLSAGQYGTDLTFLADDSRLINDVTVTDATGLVQRVQNATSITANGTYSVSKTLNTRDSSEALSWAQWQVNAVSTVTARVSQVTVDLLTQQSLIPTAILVDIGDRVDLTGLPVTAPASSVQLQVAGYTLSYSLTGFTITFNTVPFLTGNVFTFNDAILGRFNTGGVFAY